MKEGERKTVQPEEHEKQLEFNREVVYKNQRLISVFFAEDGASLLCEWVECHLLCLRMHRYISCFPRFAACAFGTFWCHRFVSGYSHLV